MRTLPRVAPKDARHSDARTHVIRAPESTRGGVLAIIFSSSRTLAKKEAEPWRRRPLVGPRLLAREGSKRGVGDPPAFSTITDGLQNACLTSSCICWASPSLSLLDSFSLVPSCTSSTAQTWTQRCVPITRHDISQPAGTLEIERRDKGRTNLAPW